MLTVAFIGQAQTTRQNRVQAIVAAFLLAAGCRLGGLAGTNFVALRPSSTWVVYAIPLGAMLLGTLMAHRGMRRRKQTVIGRKMTLVLASVQDTLQGLAGRFRRNPATGARR
jgi:hypothetical protein